MGLTRAWIGAGAKAVDCYGMGRSGYYGAVADDGFLYRACGRRRSAACHSLCARTQLNAIHGAEGGTQWAAYSLLSRIQ